MRAMPLLWSRSLLFRYRTGRWPKNRNPVGLNEKLNWRILHDHRSIWDWTCDKLAMKQHAAVRSPGVLLPTVLWSGTDLDELRGIDVTTRWIVKSNNTSGNIVIGEGRLDVDDLVRKTRHWDRGVQWPFQGEYGYSRARPLIILEQWIGNEVEPPPDYKVLVFDGVPKYIHAHSNRFHHHQASMYTPDWLRIDAIQKTHEPHDEAMPRPQHLDELLRISVEIAEGFDFVRIDLFDTEEGVWFGEISPYAWSGFNPFYPESFEIEAGEQWVLPKL